MRPVISDSHSFNIGSNVSEVILYDGSCQVKAAALSQNLSLSPISPSMVQIHGYVASEANFGIDVPALIITCYDITKANVLLDDEILADKQRYCPPKNNIVGGSIAPFLSNCAPLLAEKHLSGTSDDCLFGSIDRDIVWHFKFEDKYNKVTDFFAQHMAMQTLHSSCGPSSVNSAASTESYMSTVREFQLSQLERQNASLATNCGKETAARALQVSEQYNLTLLRALSDSDEGKSLTVEKLCTWHKMLCGNGLAPPNSMAGSLRRKNVRTGSTSYCNYEKVPLYLNLMFASLLELEERLLHKNTASRNGTLGGDFKLEQALIYASAVLMGVVDVHPFVDGNGRLSRIALNWALRRVGLPFVVHLFATDVQRKELIRALQLTRRNICLQKRGNADDEELLQSYQSAGALSPLVELILDRIYRAVVEFERLLEEKAIIRSEADEDKAARKYRERVATGTCMICYDDNPNIATLCCGKPVHINCMAEWLSNKNSCPQCRADLPSLPERMCRPSRESDTEYDETTTTSSDESAQSSSLPMGSHTLHLQFLRHLTSDDSDSGDETMDDNDDADGTTSVDGADGASTTDETTEVVMVSNDPPGTSNGLPRGSMFDDSDNTETTCVLTESATIPARVPVCFRDGCYNRAAKECQNDACGRCCLLHGQFNCLRHNC